MNKRNKISAISGVVRQQGLISSERQDSGLEKLPPAELRKMVDALVRRQAELEKENQELRQQHTREEFLKRYADLYDFAPVCFLTLDEQGKITDANLTAAERLGLPRKRLLGRSFFSFIATKDSKLFREHLKKVFQSPGRHTCEVRLKDKDGVFYACCHSTSTKARLARLCHVAAIDFNQQYTAGEEIRALMETAPLGVAVIEPGGRYRYLNPGFTRRFGYTLKDIANGREWFAKAYPDPAYRHEVISDWKAYLKESKVGEAAFRTFTVTCKDGSEKQINFRVAHLEDGNQIIFYEDITTRRQAEEALKQSEIKYRTLVEQIPAVVFKGYPDWSIDCFDQKIETLTGYSKEDFNTRRVKWSDLIPPEEMAYVKQTFKDALKADLSYVREHRILRKDGRYAWVQCRGRIFLNPEGQVEYVSGVTFDITARKQAEEALRESEWRYRLLVEQIPAVVYKGYMDWSVDCFDRKVEELTGYSLEDFNSRRIKWCDLILPEDLPRAKKAFAEALKTDCSYVREYRLRKKSGEVAYVQCRGRIFLNPEGQADYVSGVVFDVTEQKMAEEALKEGEERYRLLVEQIPAVVFKGYADWSIDCFDSKIEELTGYSLEDFNSRRIRWCDLILPEDLPRVKKAFGDALKTDSSYVREYRIRKKSGDLAWVQARGRIFSDAAGRVAYVSGVVFDVTEQKMAEEALRQSEGRYRLLVEQIPAVVFKGYTDWSIDCFDRKIEELTGYSREDFNSRRVRWSDLIPPEELDYVKQNFLNALKTNLSYVREHRIRKKTGEFAWVQCRGQIFLDAQGRVDYVSGVVFDITEHKRAEEAIRKSEARYRLLADNVSDIIWIMSLDQSLLYVSPSVERLLGYTPKETMALKLEDLMTPSSREDALKTLAEALGPDGRGKDPGVIYTKEVELAKKDGSTVWAEIKASFLRDSQGNPTRILGVTRDISERKAAEKALRRREAVLEAMRFAAEKFLEEPSWEANIQEILARLGQAIEASRVYIFENHRDPDGDLLSSQRYEWVADQVAPQIDNPDLQNFSWQESGFGRWEKTLGQGQMIFGHVHDFPPPEEEFLAAQDIKSIAVVPIFVDHQWWGFLGFDECLREREWSVVELEALKAAASTLGTAVQHDQANQALKNSQEKLRHLSSELLVAQEAERKRIANELHDELGHALLTIKLHLQSLKRNLYPEQSGLKKEIKPMLQYIDQVIGNVRRLYLDLIPGDLEYSGLTGSIRNLIEEFASHDKKVRWALKLQNVDDLFPLPVQTAIFRIFQEALTNIGKHAKPTRIAVAINRNEQEISCLIEDNGKGFQMDEILSVKGKKSLGLVAMEERVKMMGGVFEIWSQKGRGTRISFKVPVKT
ncbi:MAG: PAS domain S-box protein [Deltaproteobacteria bacterium]|nr:PAS domain S-box protein [Deltaproteobacteria bacterium]